MEKERAKLIQHVEKHFYIEKVENSNQLKVNCWLGQNPTGRKFSLFRVEYPKGEKLKECIKQLANDMWDFLHTPKGEQIIRAEAEETEKELNKWIVGSEENEKTGFQKCKKCGADVVNLRETQDAYETIRIYRQHEKENHG